MKYRIISMLENSGLYMLDNLTKKGKLTRAEYLNELAEIHDIFEECKKEIIKKYRHVIDNRKEYVKE